MPVQTRSQTKFQNVTIRTCCPTVKELTAMKEADCAEFTWVGGRLQRLMSVYADTYGREDQIRLLIEMFDIINEYSDVIIGRHKFLATIKRKIPEFMGKLTRDTHEDKILRETLKTTLKLLN